MAERTIWLLRGGYGTDGGFGDYAPPSWDEEPIRTRDGRVAWFEDESAAKAAARRLSQLASDSFYRAGLGGEYTGDFPYEYEAVKVIIPDDGPLDGLEDITEAVEPLLTPLPTTVGTEIAEIMNAPDGEALRPLIASAADAIDAALGLDPEGGDSYAALTESVYPLDAPALLGYLLHECEADVDASVAMRILESGAKTVNAAVRELFPNGVIAYR